MFFGEAFVCVCVFVFVSVLMQWRLSQENRCFGPFVFVFVFVFASDATEASMRVQMFWSLSIGGWAHWENCAALKRLEFLGELAPRPGLPASLTPTSHFLQKEKKQNRAKVFFFMRFQFGPICLQNWPIFIEQHCPATCRCRCTQSDKKGPTKLLLKIKENSLVWS